jgi:uncharacterized membrane protein YkoI
MKRLRYFAMNAAIFATVIAVVLSLGTAGAIADDDDARDHERARKALLEGRMKSLSEITELVKPQFPGQIIGVELDSEDGGRFVYEFDVLTPKGKLLEIDVDAATGAILSIEDDD